MKLEPYENDYLDLDFQTPQPGVSILQFEEGIQLRFNENSGKTTLQFPCTIDTVLEGPDDNAGLKLSHFCPVETPFGEKQLAGVLTMTGLIAAVSEKFGSDVDATSEQLVNYLKLKLPGKFIKAQHTVRKDNQGRERANITRFEAVKPKAKGKDDGGDSGKTPSPTGGADSPKRSDGDDW
jgi:hypothetical protein